MSAEGEVIGFSGVLQAVRLAAAVAREGDCEARAMHASLLSVLRLDSDTPAQVYGGLSGVSLGLRTLRDVFEGRYHDDPLTRMTVTLLHLERKLHRRPAMQRTIRETIQEQAAALRDATDPQPLIALLAPLYSRTLSTLRPRVMVQGNGLYLSQPERVAQIRALLLAAVRAAVLWRQMGGGYLSLLLHRRHYAHVARVLLGGKDGGARIP